ncbi:MAG TPA: hypothetical protein VFW49_15035 [Fluviicoccus sp.]|nr:hypothetical protein [Fluviicoccus sp.]
MDASSKQATGSHTPGPWRWEFNEKHKTVSIVGGVPKFDLTVMDFERWGMGGAVPRFRDTAHDGMNVMHRLCDRPDWIAPVKGREHHASWFANVIHPDARRIVACVNACEGISTEYLETTGLPEFAGKTLCADMVQAELDAMTKQRDQLQQLVDAQVQDIGNGMALLHRMKVERDNLLYALQMMLERIPEPPEANCSCHLSPPCNDCIEYGGEREAFESAKEAIAAVKGGQCQTCNGNGMIGGPSFREPDEGGVPCHDCQPPAVAVPVGCIPVPAEWINGLLLGDRQHHNELRAMLAAAQEGGA